MTARPRGTTRRWPNVQRCCAAPPMRSKRACPSSAVCSSTKRKRPSATALPKCVKQWTFAAITPTRPNSACPHKPCLVPPAKATSFICTGAALVADARTAGVCFTGSTAVAKIINRTLSAKDGAIVPLIAETGGINAMIVDSTALPEQVVDAVVQSAFRSAGQRCSALRLLCVHEGVADGVIEMIRGAMAELRVGDPSELSTDVGPVIDEEAFQGIAGHVQRLKREAKLLGETKTDAAAFPRLVAPAAFELKRVA